MCRMELCQMFLLPIACSNGDIEKSTIFWFNFFRRGNNLTQYKADMKLAEQIDRVILEKVLLGISSGTCFLFFCWINTKQATRSD